ncbi:hypothetical protein V8F33_006978 [Rhypophila sp. PSN 637]
MAEDGVDQRARADAPIVDDEVSFGENMSGWVAKPKDERLQSHFYFMLEGTCPMEATTAAFSIQSITPGSPDRAVIDKLTRVTANLEVELFLVLLERGPTAVGGAEEGSESGAVPKTEFIVRRLVDFGGQLYFSDYPIDESQFYQDIGPKDAIPERAEAAVLLVTRDSLASFFFDLFGFSSKNTLASSRCCADIRQGDLDHALLTDHDFLPVQTAFSRAREWEALEQVVTRTEGRLGVADPSAVGMLVRDGHVKLENVDKWVVHAHSICGKCARLAESLKGLEGPDGTSDDNHRQWVMQTFDKHVLQGTQEGRLSFEDGDEVLTLVLRLFELDEATVNYSVLALADRYPSQSSFMTGFLVRLNKALQSCTSPCPSAKKLFLDLAERTIKHLDISRFCTSSAIPLRDFMDHEPRIPAKQNQEDRLVCITSSDPAPMLVIDHEQLAEFIAALLQQKVGSARMRQLAFGIIAKAPLIRRGDFVTLWLPFLHKLIVVLEHHKVPLSKPRWSHIFAAILDAFVYTSKPQIEVMEWKTDLVRHTCFCAHCNNFRAFFAADQVELRGEEMSQYDVDHIKTYILDVMTQRTSCQYDSHTGLLVISKIGSFTEKTYREWAQAGEYVRSRVRRFDEVKLKQILGLDFSSIWNAASLVLPEAPVKVPPPPAIPIQQEPRPFPVQAALPIYPRFCRLHRSAGSLTRSPATCNHPGFAGHRGRPQTGGPPPVIPPRSTVPSTTAAVPTTIPRPSVGGPPPAIPPKATALPGASIREMLGKALQDMPPVLGAFETFVEEELPIVRQEHPRYSNSQIRQQLLRTWSKLPKDLREMCHNKAREDWVKKVPAAWVMVGNGVLSKYSQLAGSEQTSATRGNPGPSGILARFRHQKPPAPPRQVDMKSLLGNYWEETVRERKSGGLSALSASFFSQTGATRTSNDRERRIVVERVVQTLVPNIAASSSAPSSTQGGHVQPRATLPSSSRITRTSTAQPLSSRTPPTRRRADQVIVLDDSDDNKPSRPVNTSARSTSGPSSTIRPSQPPLTSVEPKLEKVDTAPSSSKASGLPPPPSGLAEAYARYEARMRPRLEKRFRYLGPESVKRSIRHSWEAMSDSDRESYCLGPVASPTSPKQEPVVPPTTASSLEKKLVVPPRTSSSPPVQFAGPFRTLSSATRGDGSSSSPLQIVSGNIQRGRTNSGASGAATPSASSSDRFGARSASKSSKRKFTGPERSSEKKKTTRRSLGSGNGIDDATMAGNLYYPPIAPTSTPAASGGAAPRTLNGSIGRSRSGTNRSAPTPMVIDLTLDD